MDNRSNIISSHKCIQNFHDMETKKWCNLNFSNSVILYLEIIHIKQKVDNECNGINILLYL